MGGKTKSTMQWGIYEKPEQAQLIFVLEHDAKGKKSKFIWIVKIQVH